MIYLSICIPTFNRSVQLKKEIESIICQKEFLEKEVEIVISDNASTDDTAKMVQEYAGKFDNIIYNCNAINLGVSNNIHKVLMTANGLYRKISNDTFVYNFGALKVLVDTIKRFENDKPVLFFTNNILSESSNCLYNNIDDFLKTISIQITSDVVHGYWAEDLSLLENININEWFWTIKFVLETYAKKKLIYICNIPLFNTQQIVKKDISYGLFYVFYEKQFLIYEYYQKLGLIKKETVRELEKKLLFEFFIKWVFHYKRHDIDSVFSKEENLAKCVNKHYYKKSYFALYLLKYAYLNLKYFIKKIIRYNSKK